MVTKGEGLGEGIVREFGIDITFDILIMFLWPLFGSLWVHLVWDCMLLGLGCLFASPG